MENAERILYIVPILLFSVVVHEYAHGYVANRWGDPTAAFMGRLTLNPLPHIDPIGSVLVPAVLLLGGSFIFGWAKPVPVNPDNYRNRRWGDVTVSLAGPASNLLLALLFTVLWIVSLRLIGYDPALEQVFRTAMILNLILAFFNLLPIPPLDGSHVLANFLPRPLAYRYLSLARYGFLILMLLLVLEPFRRILQLVYVPVGIVAGFLQALVAAAG
ncbi:MAG: site-2 protease family protein [Gemmatimonadetes bacterium]|nr:site-2 protease family protein [Gemmatimonadota bacterium]